MKKLPAKADQSLTAKTKEPSAEAGQSSNAKTSTVLSKASAIASVASAIAAVSTALLGWRTHGMAKTEYAEVVELRESLERQRTKLSDTIDRISLYEDLAAAEGGDRFAYVRANRLLREREKEGDSKAAVLLEKLHNSTERFMGDVAGNPVLAAVMARDPLDVNSDAGAMLHDRNPMQRIQALRLVSYLKRNSLIPDIFALLETEPDLGVIQMALHVINEAFIESFEAGTGVAFSDIGVSLYVLNYDEARAQFDQAWEMHRNWLLQQEQSELKKTHGSNNGGSPGAPGGQAP